MDCVFEGNAAGEDGGAVNLNSRSGARFVGGQFRNNRAGGAGGAIDVDVDTGAGPGAEADVSFEGVTFAGNEAQEKGGAVEVYKGSSVRFRSCAFRDNGVGARGEGGGAIYAASQGGQPPAFDLEDCSFEGNRAPRGPDLMLRDGDVRFDRRQLQQNGIAPTRFSAPERPGRRRR